MEILDMAWTLISGVLGVVIGAWIAKHMMFSERNTLKMATPLIEYLKKDLLAWIQTDQASKLLFQIGGVVAAGAKSGFGLTPKTGKFRIEDMIGQLIGTYIQGKIVPKTEPVPTSESPMGLK